MTSPSFCAYGVIRVGTCMARIDLCLYPGFMFDGNVQLEDSTGAGVNWPAGTSARMRVITDGTGSDVLLFAAEPVTDSWLRFHLTDVQTLTIPRRGEIYIDLNYGAGWIPWAMGRRAGICR